MGNQHTTNDRWGIGVINDLFIVSETCDRCNPLSSMGASWVRTTAGCFTIFCYGLMKVTGNQHCLTSMKWYGIIDPLSLPCVSQIYLDFRIINYQDKSLNYCTFFSFDEKMPRFSSQVGNSDSSQTWYIAAHIKWKKPYCFWLR